MIYFKKLMRLNFMKNYMFIIFLICSLQLSSQTATNFTCNDCSGTTYDLFTELDAGKVVVICWVMPCGSCVAPALSAYNIVAGYQALHPNKVFFYLADDFANTNCATLDNWASSNNIPSSAFSLRFSNASINMSDYGTLGMPKIVVLGGHNHNVFYNVNDAVNQTALSDAINEALESTGTLENFVATHKRNIFIYPNPTNNSISISLRNKNSDALYCEVYNYHFSLVINQMFCNESLNLDCKGLAKGLYYVVIRNSKNRIVGFNNFTVGE
ncbi:MAG: hypothetical protein BWY70_00195 [Bacteroidetes bacterium ADurb.Bin408]|nr:MAG: hypothetical protein BWY70_00195 [Bacteroidetes bacterium ADurb.Bin408]